MQAQPQATSWRNIALAIFAALTAAFQIGKAIIALPLLQGAPLHLSLRETGLVISSLAMVGAVLAMPLGLMVSRFDARKVLCAGVAVLALTNFAGGLASGLSLLIASRVVEGIAVVVLLICASSVVGRQAAPRERDLAMALSSTAVPSGIALVMLGATVAASLGYQLSWQLLWQLNGWVAVASGLVVWLGLPAMPALASTAADGGAWNAIGRVAQARGAQLIALCFATYAMIYFAFSGFLPLLLRDLLGLSARQAGYVSAAIVAVNVLGNISAGALMRRGVPPRWVVGVGFAIGAACISLLFWAQLPMQASVAVAMLMTGCMGSIPGALTAGAPKAAPSAALVPPTIGFMLQGSYVGQLLGPLAAGVLAQAGGWSVVAWMLLALAAGGVLLARKL
ncbi:putative MFS family arabinose efflux permease [Comamonas odontotermitis]|uniref:MFS family arabinose efflux permease n=1 Tax=Comamonas odontotermitis TaxID=379895 RepID=A0ABR6RL96_9BURK|nr:MFS transporter [Comamonas odontotermitis]MBB6579953.1 putative MFS family arabinose efflux permease [Comamonas odontotermitis]